KIRKKDDGYVQTFGLRPIKWAASEAGSKWEGEQGTKLIKEHGLSLPKTLKDIFISLAHKVNFSEEKIRKINVPGFVHS
ncbi:11757_t:CDS:1, partial [Entrophospora sp. SA101]